jgi:hypothetical protein
MKPEDVFKKIAWRSTLAVGEGLEKSTTWTIGGVAGIAALLVGNIDAVSKVVDPSGLKAALVLLGKVCTTSAPIARCETLTA